ncbi:MAG: aldehyde dehydrogenase family protein, partial [Acidobacteriaceae bacterium]|nr:aldehyde dehydrogenase family protein [Acidobacteriaceae bacterium]
MAIASINPATGETLKTFEPLTRAAIDSKVNLAWTAFHIYKKTSFTDRRNKLNRAAEILETESERFGRIMTSEMGKTLKSATAEALKCATACRYYSQHGEQHLADEVIPSSAARSLVRYQPLGPVLAVMPWNFPFWQVFRFAAPALMAGNAGLLKHSSNVPQCALAIEEIFRGAGFAEGVFQTLLIDSSQVESILDDDRIAAATLTGSEPAGRAVAARAGRQIKKTVLELGGSDPFIVMPSTDLPSTVAAAVSARTINNGQSCIAAKRFIVAAAIYEDFEREFVRGMEALRVGDPMQPSTDIGPLATAKIRDDLHDQVVRASESGATVLTGGNKIQG